MKNLIVNIYKTLFFFDFAIVAAYIIPKIKTSSAALNALFAEGVSFAAAALFTFIFIRLVERGRLRVFNTKNKMRHYSLGLLAGVVPAAVTPYRCFFLNHFRLTALISANPRKF